MKVSTEIGESVSSNGDGVTPGIPPDVEWNSENPPIIYQCSQHTSHDPHCDGNCESEVSTENQILLLNESKQWAREGLDTSQIQTNAFHIGCQVNALQKVLVDAGIIDQETVDDNYRKIKYDVLHEVRASIGPQIKEARTRAILGVDEHKRIIGPGGLPL
jgi:hypothetical protein